MRVIGIRWPRWHSLAFELKVTARFPGSHPPLVIPVPRHSIYVPVAANDA